MPTFSRRNQSSIIDVTFSTRVRISGWRVDADTESLSDHRYIYFDVNSALDCLSIGRRESNNQRNCIRGWSFRKVNEGRLIDGINENVHLIEGQNVNGASEAAGALQHFLKNICDASMPRRTINCRRRAVYWWTEEIGNLRSLCIAARRTYQRAGRRASAVNREEERIFYITAKKKLTLAIKTSKKKAWRELCDAVDNDPWGVPYRIVTQKLGRDPPGLAAQGREEDIANYLFPTHPICDWNTLVENQLEPEQEPEPLTSEELFSAVGKMSLGKAPGPDGIPNIALIMAVRKKPVELLGVFNECFKDKIFPERWKTAKLLLIHKGKDKPVSHPSSYRPICLLDAAGKLLERLILGRLNQHIEITGGLSESQFGFRRGRSTLNAIQIVLDRAKWAGRGTWKYRDLFMLITLDVRNAFNSAPWIHIEQAIRERQVPKYLADLLRSFLSQRRILVGGLDESDQISRQMTCGVPQGSVLGPILWNLFYDDLLRTRMPEGVRLVGFADDVAMAINAPNTELIEQKANSALLIIHRWMTDHGLDLAPDKTEAAVITRKRAYRLPEIRLMGTRIPIKQSIRYLGVELDKRLTFRQHMTKVALSAMKATRMLSGLMPNIGGPSQRNRVLLSLAVVHSKLLYAASVWAKDGLKTERNRRTLNKAQRIMAIRATRCYSSVSDMASILLVGTPPVDLLALERTNIEIMLTEMLTIKEAKKIARESTMEIWQVRWTNTTKASWTKRLLPNIQRWISRLNQISISYHLAQGLTGHGCFQEYLFRRSRALDPKCVYCPEPRDTAEHTIFICPRWNENRREITRMTRHAPRAEDAEDLLCGPQLDLLPEDEGVRMRLLNQATIHQNEFISMIQCIMATKERDERQRQVEERDIRNG
jgi:hypothetical protein